MIDQLEKRKIQEALISDLLKFCLEIKLRASDPPMSEFITYLESYLSSKIEVAPTESLQVSETAAQILQQLVDELESRGNLRYAKESIFAVAKRYGVGVEWVEPKSK